MISVKLEVIEVPVTTFKKEEQVTLTMSVEMAQFLYDLTQKIGGDPKTTRRKFGTELGRELRQLSCINSTYINKYGNPCFGPDDIEGGMIFTASK